MFKEEQMIEVYIYRSSEVQKISASIVHPWDPSHDLDLQVYELLHNIYYLFILPKNTTSFHLSP